MTISYEFPDELLKLVSKDYAEEEKLSVSTELQITKIIKNPYSNVYLLKSTTTNTGPNVYVKIPHSEFQGHDTLTERLIAEFNILKTMNETFNNESSIGVATPLGIYKKYPALATLDAGNKTLRMQYRTGARLLSRGRSKTKLNIAAKNAGIWLRQFQESTTKGKQQFQTEELAAYCDVRIRALKMGDKKYIPSDTLDRILTGINNLANITSEQNLVAGRHNDFASHNILLENDKLNVIDFSMFDFGSTAYDPCNFWLDLEALKLDCTYSSSQIEKMQDIFLESYGYITSDSAFFNLARCRYTLNRIVTSSKHTNGWSPSAFYRRRLINSCSNWLTDFSERYSS